MDRRLFSADVREGLVFYVNVPDHDPAAFVEVMGIVFPLCNVAKRLRVLLKIIRSQWGQASRIARFSHKVNR